MVPASDKDVCTTDSSPNSPPRLGSSPTQLVRAELRALGTRLRERHPWLEARQDLLGLTIFLGSIAATLAMGFGYAKGWLPAWLTVPAIALCLSFLHELEHDLIHNLYFPNNKFLYNTMMAGVWLFRPSTISPWVRRRLHLHHHKLSGTESDLEEIAITNGEPWGLRRVLMMADGMLAIALRPGRIFAVSRRLVVEQRLPSKEARRRVRWETRLGYAPLGLLYYPLWHATLALALIRLAETATGPSLLPSTSVAHLLESLWPGRGAHVAEALQLLAVVVLMPNALRSFCLNFVSSNIHYFGDIEGGNIVQQTQVWTAPWTWPFQLFCFNFGGTHAIHHFVVNDPFYIRQAIAKDAHAVMKQHGVRFNDFGTFRRSNRWETEAPAKDHIDAGTNGHDNREGNFATAV